MLEIYAAMQHQEMKQSAAGALVAEARQSASALQTTSWISGLNSSEPARYPVGPVGVTVGQSDRAKVIEASNPELTSFISSHSPQAQAKSSPAVRSFSVTDTASRRVQMLAVKYASSQPSKEVQARLAILDARMNDIAPRVSSERSQSLLDAKAAIEASDVALDELDRFLG